jgi:glycosyl transferase family 25
MEHIDKIIVINLKKRVDRYLEMKNEFSRLNIPEDKIEFFSAIPIKEMPCLGCCRSHLEVAKLIKERNYKNTIVLEDDFNFLITREKLEEMLSYFFNLTNVSPTNVSPTNVSKLDWRTIMLCYGINSTIVDIGDDVVALTTNCQNAAGYMVNLKYIDDLINCLEYGYNNLYHTGMHWLYTNDQVWKRLQQDNKWFIFKTRVGEQRLSFSDLGGKLVKND